MLQAFKTGFAYAAGALSAALIFLAVLGFYDWASEMIRYLVNLSKLARFKREARGA